MDKHKLMCKFLIEADSYFDGKNVNTEKINKHSTIKGYCRNGDCKTNEAGINALTTYIFKEFKRSIEINDYNEYDECFLMWLSDKLFKMYYDSKGKDAKKGFVYLITLNQAYAKYLEKHKGILDYWTLFDMIKDLKEANLKYMSEFYKLLNNICNTIVDYENNGTKSTKLFKNSVGCRRQYRILYNNISECKSYLDLLNKLKGIYDDFRSSAIRENGSNNNLAAKLQTLTTPNGVEMGAVRSFKSYKFSNQKCYPPKKNTKPKKQDPPRLPPSSKEEPPPPPLNQLKDSQRETPPSSQSSNALPKIKTGESRSSDVQDASENNPKTSDNSEGKTKDASGDKGSSSSGTENPGGESSDKSSEGSNGDKKDLQIDQSTTQDNSQEQHEDLTTSGGSVDNSPKDKGSTDNTMEHQQNDSLGSNPKEKPQDIQKGTPPLQEPETKELEPPNLTIPQPEQQQPQPSGQPEDNQRETSQPSASKPELKNGQRTSDIPPKGASNEQKDSGGGTEHQKRPQSDSKDHAQTPVPNKRGSDDVPGGDSGGSKYGEKDIDNGPLNPGGVQGDQRNSNDGSSGGSEDSNGGEGDTDKRTLNTGGEQDNKGGSGVKSGKKGDQAGSTHGSVAGGTDINKEGANGGQGVTSSGPGVSGGGAGIPVSGKGGTHNVQGDSGGGKGNGTGVSGGGQTSTNGGVGDPGTNQGGGSGGGSGSEQGGSDSPPVENGTQSMPGEPFNTGSFIFKISLKGMEKLNDAINSFEMIKNKFIGATQYIYNLYNTTLPSIKNGFNKSIDFFNGIINSISIDFKQVDPPAGSDNNKSESGGTGSGSPAPDDPPPPPKGLDQTSQSSQTLQTSQDPQNSLLPKPKEQIDAPKLPQDPPGNQHSDQNDQEEPQKPAGVPVIKSEHPVSEVKGNETIGIGDIYIFKGYKQFVILTIVLLIPIALAIMYKYLSFGRRNELKKKNNMKKVINMVGVNKTAKMVINSTDGKKQIQIIIKSSSQKKQTKKSINFVYGEKSPSLNIYQLMQADPVPFINLFFLLIFFVYKRKRDFIE
ncbi:Plasmodium variant antigen protein Cir/Yir/Bir, putative [Plasmodium chabaudi chabaudi]|uniref:Plasmodium variant antigen protein Cir/Yir/Bir, putative n=1 Tax=Plasmodium chabaudi chabaudi TaxID=31271 RepID=A0A1D3LA57_PLACU|nr:Plasmodium variant antigen protein Cir/Yir/Bir, putative [Plasmodium chabaudi chabaudi]